jgi:hypothetical protein
VTLTAIVSTVGVCIAFLTWPVAGVLGAFVAGAVMGGAMTAALAPENLPQPWRRAALGATGAGVGVVAIAGLVVLLEAAVVLVMLAAVVSAPPLVRWLRRRFTGKSSGTDVAQEQQPSEPPLDDLPTIDWPGPDVMTVEMSLPMDPESLDDHALCLAWRHSYVLLQRSHSAATRIHIVDIRQAYLDELERRNALGLAAWLASGARAAGDPSRFIQHHPSRHQRD